LADAGVQVTELAAYLAGQVLALHPAYVELFAGFYPEGLSSNERIEWAGEQIRATIRASVRLGCNVVPVLSGGFAWHMMYPWPQRPPGIIEEAMRELARLWMPLLDYAHERGVVLAFELHPGSDVFDGATFEQFLGAAREHPAIAINYDPSHFLLQQLDYVEFIELYGAFIKGFHVKDAEFRPSGRVGVYGGYQPWLSRAGRFRSLGDGQVDFTRVFSALTQQNFGGWAVLEWECCLKDSDQGASEGAPFILRHMIKPTNQVFDDFAGSSPSGRSRELLGLSPTQGGEVRDGN
jgi:sugar phosphate isomerase/epimerase